MTKRFLFFIVCGILVLIVVGVILLGQGSYFFGGGRKIEVSNLKIDYGKTLYSDFQSTVYFRAKNLHSSYLTTVGLEVNGVNYGLSTLQVPSGQIQDESLPVNNMALSSLTTYSIELTFTFADGKYQTYSGSYTTPQFRGQAKVTSISLTGGVIRLTIQNTGNLPITRAMYNFINQDMYITVGLMPGDSATGGMSYSSLIFQVGKAYSVTIQVEYLDGSTSTINTSVIAQS